jgi:hypothetical protein
MLPQGRTPVGSIPDSWNRELTASTVGSWQTPPWQPRALQRSRALARINGNALL